jgi:hypothetical protein
VPSNFHPRVAPQQIGSSSSSLAPPRTSTAARVEVPAEKLVGAKLQAHAAGRAAEPRAGHLPDPNRLQESGLGNLTAAFHPRSADPGRRLAGAAPATAPGATLRG